MTIEEIKAQADRLVNQLNETISVGKPSSGQFEGAWAEAAQFINDFGGKDSKFAGLIKDVDLVMHDHGWVIGVTESAINALVRYLDHGLHRTISPERQAQIDVVSDFLEQSNTLLQDKKIHPAAPAVIIGASLEEFLRNWAEDEGLIVDTSKSSIDTYSKLLREKKLLTKQDIKDIISWAGTRNDAAHGNWDQVSDSSRIKIMLEGVNYFIQKHTPSEY